MSDTEMNNPQQMQEQLDLYREVVASYRHREKLLKEIGTAHAGEIVSMIQSMESQLKDLYAHGDTDHPDHAASGTDSTALHQEIGTADAHEIIAMVKNMESQLKDFYAKGDADHPDFQGEAAAASGDSAKLADELGTSNADEIISMVRNMEEQLRDFYAQGDEGVQNGTLSSLEI